jgi:hypothetical protein
LRLTPSRRILAAIVDETLVAGDMILAHDR